MLTTALFLMLGQAAPVPARPSMPMSPPVQSSLQSGDKTASASTEAQAAGKAKPAPTAHPSMPMSPAAQNAPASETKPPAGVPEAQAAGKTAPVAKPASAAPAPAAEKAQESDKTAAAVAAPPRAKSPAPETSAASEKMAQTEKAPAETPAPQPVPGSAGPELLQIKTVYLLSMSRGFDQYLANRLTRSGILQVVTDPDRADAIFTDGLGGGFEAAMKTLYPPPKVEEPEKKAEDEQDKGRNDSDRPSFSMKSEPVVRLAASSRGKGTIFLVHRGSRNVVWSIYDRPKNSRPDEMDETARTVVSALESAIKKQARRASGKRHWLW